jgi:hypothetical protein
MKITLLFLSILSQYCKQFGCYATHITLIFPVILQTPVIYSQTNASGLVWERVSCSGGFRATEAEVDWRERAV